MKIIIGIVLLLIIGGTVQVNGQTNFEFGYVSHPQKLLENTQGIIYIYTTSNGKTLPITTDGLKVSSSDTSIMEIINVANNGDFTNTITILAKEPGTVNLSLAAPGFKSKQIPLTIYTNNNHPTQILLKTTPNDFPVDGPKFGYIGIELATTGGLPTTANEDVKIKLTSPNIDIISLHESEITIPRGEYYALTKFDIRSPGDAIIFAESEGMKRVSDFVHVREAETPLQLQLYVFPKNFNSFSSQIGYAIIQLQDAAGIPVKTDKDIKLKIGVENPDSGINTSHDFEEFLFKSKELIIEEGSYSTYTSFSLRPNISDFTNDFEQTYKFFITANDYISKGDSVRVTHDEISSLEGKGPAITQTIPFLTTGEKEILGISYFETEIEVSRKLGTSTLGVTDREIVKITVPVMASNDFEVDVTSSNLATVNADNAYFSKGKNAALIFGDTGTVLPDSGSIEFYITDNKQTNMISGKPEGPLEDNLNLSVEPLISKILANTEFPVIGYLLETEDEESEVSTSEDEDEEDGRIGVTHFIKNSVLTFSADEKFEVPSKVITQNQEYAVITGNSYKPGTSTLTAQAIGLESQLGLQSHTTDPTQIQLSYPEKILPKTNNLLSIQLLDSVGNPAYAKETIKFEIVSNNQDSIKLPDSITIEKGEYYKTFESQSFTEGIADVTILAENLPMVNYELLVEGFQPEISLTSPSSVNIGEQFDVEISVNYSNDVLKVSDFEVEWNVSGGLIKTQETITDKHGKANVTIETKTNDDVEINVSVNGMGFTNLQKTSTVKVNPIETVDIVTENKDESMDLFSQTNMIFFTIPGAAIAAVLYLKKSNRLDDITERFNITERLDGIRDRISEFRDR